MGNRQGHMHAFAMVREGMAFLERTMPLGTRFPRREIFREDRFPVPRDALREILLNGVMHLGYSQYSGYVAITIFDDRIEIQSYGRLPAGPQVTPQVVAALTAARSEVKTREELQKVSGIKDREHFRKAYLEPMLASGWLERTIPDKPRRDRRGLTERPLR